MHLSEPLSSDSDSDHAFPRRISTAFRRPTFSNTGTNSSDTDNVRHSTWRRMSRSFHALTSRRSSTSLSSLPESAFKKRRTFLSYAFIWTGSTMRGFLVRIRDLDLDSILPPCGVAESFSDAGELTAAQRGLDLIASSRTLSGMFLTLVRFLGARSRADFAAKLAAHVRHLPTWRAAVRDAAPSSSPRDGAAAALCLLEAARSGRTLRRDRYCGFSAVAVQGFDFRPDGCEDNIARRASMIEAEAVSCAAMIVLLELQDEIGCEFGECGICERDGTDEKKLETLREDILAMYDERPGGCRYRCGAQQRVAGIL